MTYANPTSSLKFSCTYYVNLEAKSLDFLKLWFRVTSLAEKNRAKMSLVRVPCTCADSGRNPDSIDKTEDIRSRPVFPGHRLLSTHPPSQSPDPRWIRMRLSGQSLPLNCY